MKIRTIIQTTTVLGALIALIALGGCSVDPPKPHQFENMRSYPNVSFDQGWENVVGFFANNSIPIKNIAKDSGVIYAETIRFSSGMADCGGDWEDWEHWDAEDKALITAPGKFNVYFRQGDPITVTVNAIFMIGNERANWRCESTGVLEGMVLDAVKGTGRTQDASGDISAQP